MTILFDGFEIKETFACSVEKLFSAFIDPATKRGWYADGNSSATHETLEYSLDARVGGKEIFRIVLNDKTPVPGLQVDMEGEFVAREDNMLLVCRTRMITGGKVVSIANEAFEFAAEGDKASLKLTQQGAYLEGSDGPLLRRNGHEQLLAGLHRYLEA
ncbi:SRPBCC domain-containing protein [Caulobacter sp. SL161]|uniref:SRPBCC domain-containing protein n=1 Tax=Caulobacter sp. SL161 TaxID=2995156 RepID=UPI002275A24F|nr:SRPBCC domain-containing protein [Caulobacter sp. SL161]MCY1646196.1 SRPBCC domain-containing protein [Caulobacter sp. SL161]